MSGLSPSGRIKFLVTGARGGTFSDVARQSGAFGSAVGDTDIEVFDKFADYAIQENPGFKGDTGETGPVDSTYSSLAALKNAPITNLSYKLVTAAGMVNYAYIAGDFTGLDDEANVVKQNSTPISTGAFKRQSATSISYTNSESVNDFLSSVIRLGGDIQISANTTLSVSAFGKIHEVTVPCTVTLPTPSTSSLHNVIVIRVGDACGGMVNISGPLPYGVSSLSFWAGEEVELEWIGTSYKIRTPYKRAMAGVISNETGNISLPDGTFVNFPVNSPNGDRNSYDIWQANGGVAGELATKYTFYLDSVNSRITIPRAGFWRIQWNLSVTPSTDGTLALTIAKNGEEFTLECYSEHKVLTAYGRQGYDIERAGYTEAGSYFIPRARMTGGTAAIDNAVSGIVVVSEVI